MNRPLLFVSALSPSCGSSTRAPSRRLPVAALPTVPEIVPPPAGIGVVAAEADATDATVSAIQTTRRVERSDFFIVLRDSSAKVLRRSGGSVRSIRCWKLTVMAAHLLFLGGFRIAG